MVNLIKVLHVAPLPPPLGGMTSYIQGLLNSDVFRTIEYRVVRFSYFNKEKYFGMTRFLANCLNAVILTINFLLNVVFWRPDIVHIQSSSGHGFFEKSWIAFLAKIFRRKTIFHFHGGYMREWYEQSSRLKQFFIRQSALINDRIMTGSPQMRETWLYIGIPEDKMIYIGNAVNLPAQYSTELSFKHSISLLFLTRVVLEKGIIELIDSYLSLQKETENLKLRIVGADTADTLYVKKYLHDVDKNNLVEYVGPVSDEQKHKEYLEADIFVFPTYVEDQSYAVMEAMSYGLPVIASNVGGVPSLITHEQNGYLVLPKDVDSLRQGIKKIISAPDLREKLGKNARKTIEQGFTWEIRSQEIVALYTTLVKAKQDFQKP
jgi:glycosyltransferase involved in cell wall biosynthesis